MSSRAHEVLSKRVLRVDSGTPLSDTLVEIRRKRASHVAVFSQTECLGVSSCNDADAPAGDTTLEDLLQRQPCPSVSDTTSLEELGRLFADPRIDAQIVHNDQGAFVGVVTRQSLLEGLLKEREQTEASLSQSNATLRKQAEASLRDSEARSRTLLEGSPVCIKFVDLDSRLQYMSRAGQEQLQICNIEPFYGSTFPPELYPECWRAPVAEHLERAKAGEISSLECPVLDTKGNEVWFDTTFVPARDEDGIVQHIIVTSVNITERKQAEWERERLIAGLESKNAELERFVYTVSHDLKSPLLTISGFLGVLKQDVAAGDAEAAEKDVTFISDAARKMEHLLNDLLQISRIGRQNNPPEEIALADLAQDAVSMASGRLDERGIQTEISPDLPVVFGDRLRLWEVFQNLVDNAAKFMGDQPQPRIEIGCRRDGHETTCYVRDNGIGIDPAYHEKVFGLFDRLNPENEGTGVGLAIVKRIVEAHGGLIWVESEGTGRGSTFCLTIPRRRQATSDERNSRTVS